MKQVVLKATLIVSLIGLSACTLAWGRSFTQVDATPDFVKYKYWLTSVDEGGMNKEARAYCSVYQKDAVLQNRQEVDGHQEYINTYVCTQPIIYIPSVPVSTL